MIFYWQSRDGAVVSVDYSSAAAIAPHYSRKNSRYCSLCSSNKQKSMQNLLRKWIFAFQAAHFPTECAVWRIPDL